MKRTGQANQAGQSGTRPLLSEKQREYWRNANRRWGFKTGATRAGKTYMDYFLIPKRILAGKGKDGMNVILGNTEGTIRRNILVPMQNMYGAGRISNIRYDKSCLMFGEPVFILGADNAAHVDRIRGMSIKYAYGDEVVTWNPEVFDMLKSRLDKPYSLFDGTCNPGPPSHWVKEFLDSDADIYQQAYTIDDNPFLDPAFVSNLKKEYAGTVYYKRYILGEWALAEGMIYPMYQTGILKEKPAETVLKRVVSIDYGTMNAFAALSWAQYSNFWLAEKEYYYSGRDSGMTKTPEEYAQDLDRFTEDLPKPVRVIIDPSATYFIATLQRRQHRYKVIKSKNDVLEGIKETATAIQTGKVKYLETCKCLIREMQGYVWDDNAIEDRPVKVNDHACDALRYLCYTLNVTKPKTTPLAW
ncbi:MAG: PBSX family phage terminase large subunit [Abditibacteriota bacterium]|nr:PBSX family phage terminase large subunit [Abditibacteriota bacterium]